MAVKTKLEWYSSNKPPLQSEGSNERQVSSPCLVRTDEAYDDQLIIGYYITPALDEKIQDSFWADKNGNPLPCNVLFWSDLKETADFLTNFCVTLS